MIKTKIHHLICGSAILVSTSLIVESTVKSDIRAPVTATRADRTANTVRYEVNRNDIIERVAVQITRTNRAPTNTWPLYVDKYVKPFHKSIVALKTTSAMISAYTNMRFEIYVYIYIYENKVGVRKKKLINMPIK